ncbi:MAG: DUF1573 domain-containing protein [Bacteroidia bacterium]
MRLAFVFVLAISSLISWAQIHVSDITFEQELIDFGTIYESDGPLEVTFRFKNNSPFDLLIRDIDVACGCTKPRSYERKIIPGDSGIISAEFNPKGILGNVTKWIHIKANFKNTGFKELKFKAEILGAAAKRPVDPTIYYPGQFGYLLPLKSHMNFKVQKLGFIGRDSIEFRNDGYQEYTIEAITDAPAHISAVNLPLTIPKEQSAWVVFEVNTSQLDTIGQISATFHIKTNDRFYPTKEFTTSITLEQDFSSWTKKQLKKAGHISFDKTTVDMGEMKSGQVRTKEITITNTGKSMLKILRMETDCSCAILNNLPSSLAPGQSVKATVRFDSLFKKGGQKKGITLYTNDPSNPVAIITVAALVN